MMKLGTSRIKGTMWDECEKSEIVQILVSHEDLRINSIQFVYLSNGKITHSEIHGEPTGLYFDMVTFDYPSEFLSCVSGEIGSDGLVSIAFKSNKREFGPFGSSGGCGKQNEGYDTTAFPLFGRKVIGNNPSEYSEPLYKRFNYNFGRKSSFGGFHGSISHPMKFMSKPSLFSDPRVRDTLDKRFTYVNGIGVYVKPIMSPDELSNE